MSKLSRKVSGVLLASSLATVGLVGPVSPAHSYVDWGARHCSYGRYATGYVEFYGDYVIPKQRKDGNTKHGYLVRNTKRYPALQSWSSNWSYGWQYFNAHGVDGTFTRVEWASSSCL